MNKEKVMTFFRVFFCVLACLAASAAVPVGIFFGWWAILPVALMGLFAFLMVGFKNGFRAPEPEPKPDFMNTPEENEKLRKDKEDKTE